MTVLVFAIKQPDPANFISGGNWWAILVAALAVYAIGFVIYGLVFQKYWMAQTGYTEERLKPHVWKMSLSWIMPLLTAFGLAWLLSLARIEYGNLASAWVVCIQAWLLFVVSTRLYGYVYGPERIGHLVLDAIHLLLGMLAAGTIIAIWR